MNVKQITNVAEAREWCSSVRTSGVQLGFVPTMGSLHAGHLELVRQAAAENGAACVSIFVNPLQFNDPKDLERYPRDFAKDAELLDQAGCTMVFTGTLPEFFPIELDANGHLHSDYLRDPGLGAEGLEGETRPGHFAGVATIVDRLFDVVEPDRAYFGAKDFQQTLVVRDLARRRGGPRIIVHPTVREESGLAMSSRNSLLGPEGRAQGMFLSRALYAAKGAWNAGERRPRALSRLMAGVMMEGELQIEYSAVRDPEAWAPGDSEGALERGIALVAARVKGTTGTVRLLDNLLLS